jgi:tetratricopeptide (TPR) repeat protein
LEADFADETEPAQPEPGPPPDETPPTFTTLDQMLMRSVVAAVADVHGALAPEKVEDLVEEVIQLNLERHQSYYHRGFLTVLLDRPLELDFPGASDARRGWYACGAILGFKRRNNLDAVVDLLTQRPELARELARPGTGYAERVASIVYEAFCAKGRFAEAARLLSPAVVGRAGVTFAREVLETASSLIRERREADARRLLEVLLSALPMLSEDPDLPADFHVLLQRRRAHCARLRGDFDAAKKLLEPQLDVPDAAVRSDILADLGLIECGLRSLADVRLPQEESMLEDFAAEFTPGWRFFERSSKVATGGRSHGDFCIGMALFARGNGAHAIPYLERAVAGMSADPDRYGRFGPLDSARLALSVALAELTDLARVPYARDLMRQVLDARTKAPQYMLRRALTALELTDTDAAIELAHELYAADGTRALAVLAETRMIRHVSAALDELLGQARRMEFTPERRWHAAKVVLVESHAMRDASEGDGPAAFRERATEALDIMVEVATHDELLRAQTIDLFADSHGPWRTAIDALDARVVQAALYEASGQFDNAASELAQAFHSTLDVDDEWALGKAEALLDDIRALGGDGAVAHLEPRLHQYREVFERRSQSGLVIPPTADPRDLYGLVLVIGGNETQSQQDEAISGSIKKAWPNITLMFERTGWNSNWGEQLRAMEGELARARVVVIMRYVRTMLGKALRKRCNELEIPWVACTGSGRASMLRAIEQAILLAWRQSGLAHTGQ